MKSILSCAVYLVLLVVVLMLMFSCGCSATYRPPVVAPRDKLLLIDCATPWRIDKMSDYGVKLLNEFERLS